MNLTTKIQDAIYKETAFRRDGHIRFILITYDLVDDFVNNYYDSFNLFSTKRLTKEEIREGILSGHSKYMGLTIKVLNEKDYEHEGFSIL